VLTNWMWEDAVPIGFLPQWPGNGARGFFSFRNGGVSQAPFGPMNTGLHVGDHSPDVLQNRHHIANIMDRPLASFVFAEQTHGSAVAVITGIHRGRGATESATSIQGVDAMVTSCVDVTLAIMVADCVPILFYDPLRHVVAAAHSGWKGTLSHICSNVIREMTVSFGSRPADIRVWIGPSIRRCCYEVDDAVALQMQAAFGGRVAMPRFGRPGKWWLSLQSAVKQDLRARGLQTDHIHDTGICTACRTDILFSHRRENGRTGRTLAAIQLQPPTPVFAL